MPQPIVCVLLSADAVHLIIMAHLENNPTEMIHWLNDHLLVDRDVLLLARSQAFEKSGQLSIPSRRILANARLCANPQLKTMEKTFKGPLFASLTKVVGWSCIGLYLLDLLDHVQVKAQSAHVSPIWTN